MESDTVNPIELAHLDAEVTDVVKEFRTLRDRFERLDRTLVHDKDLRSYSLHVVSILWNVHWLLAFIGSTSAHGRDVLGTYCPALNEPDELDDLLSHVNPLMCTFLSMVG